MNSVIWASSLARYNRLANNALYVACSELSDAGYRAARPGSFGSVRNLLNHMLLGDRIWMARFTKTGDGAVTPPLDTILHDEFTALRAARETEDLRIENFFASIEDSFLADSIAYRNSRGVDRSDPASLCVPHFFNHQTHHRGQVHVMLAHAGAPTPNLDLHRLLKP